MASALTIFCRKCNNNHIIRLPKKYDNELKGILHSHKSCDEGYTLKVVSTDYLHDYRPSLNEIMQYQQKVKRPLVGVEIGTLYGKNTYNFFQFLDINKFYLIDPYSHYDDYDMEGRTENPDDIYISAKKLLEPYKEKIEFIRDFSENAIDKIPNEIDFAYIDGNHDYEHVKKDLELYYPKVRIGGIVGGHDLGCHEPGVLQAVGEFIIKHNIRYKERKCKSFLEDWYIIKE